MDCTWFSRDHRALFGKLSDVRNTYTVQYFSSRPVTWVVAGDVSLATAPAANFTLRQSGIDRISGHSAAAKRKFRGALEKPYQQQNVRHRHCAKTVRGVRGCEARDWTQLFVARFQVTRSRCRRKPLTGWSSSSTRRSATAWAPSQTPRNFPDQQLSPKTCRKWTATPELRAPLPLKSALVTTRWVPCHFDWHKTQMMIQNIALNSRRCTMRS